jgi:hypothetical protein
LGVGERQEHGEIGDGQQSVDRNRIGDSRSRTPWTRRVVGSRRPRLDTGGAGLGEARSREASKRSSATAGRSRRMGHQRARSRTARCPKLRTTFLRPARARRGAAAPSSSDTVMEMLRIVDDGIGGSSGGEVVAVVGLPFTGWAWISLDGRYGLGMCCTLCPGPWIQLRPPTLLPFDDLEPNSALGNWFVPKLYYSLRPIILFANMDISRYILVVDTSILAKSNMGRREYFFLNTRIYYIRAHIQREELQQAKFCSTSFAAYKEEV